MGRGKKGIVEKRMTGGEEEGESMGKRYGEVEGQGSKDRRRKKKGRRRYEEKRRSKKKEEVDRKKRRGERGEEVRRNKEGIGRNAYVVSE